MKALEIEFVKGTLHVNGRPASAWVEDVERLEAEKAAAGSDIADAWADALRFRWMCRYPDWHFIEHLCRQTSASTSAEFLAELRRVIDARRSVELEPLEQHMPPDDQAWDREAERITREAFGSDVDRPINPQARSIDDL